MSQLLQVLDGGVEFWKCLNCGRTRRILPSRIATIFEVPPEFCSDRCRKAFLGSDRRNEYLLRDQMSFGDIPGCAVNE